MVTFISNCVTYLLVWLQISPLRLFCLLISFQGLCFTSFLKHINHCCLNTVVRYSNAQHLRAGSYCLFTQFEIFPFY